MKSFVELVRYLFTIPGVPPFLSRRVTQDPLEKFFGLQRQRGRVNENPNVAGFLKNTKLSELFRHAQGVFEETVGGIKIKTLVQWT